MSIPGPKFVPELSSFTNRIRVCAVPRPRTRLYIHKNMSMYIYIYILMYIHFQCWLRLTHSEASNLRAKETGSFRVKPAIFRCLPNRQTAVLPTVGFSVEGAFLISFQAGQIASSRVAGENMCLAGCIYHFVWPRYSVLSLPKNISQRISVVF